MSLSEARAKGWDELDIILVSGDAYVDHPGFGTAIIGRVLESAGFSIGVIAQPDWTKKESFEILGKPRLFFSVSAGNTDSLVNNYTPLLNKRESDAYSPGGKPGLRPDRAVISYANRIREAYPDVPVVAGGIEASLRRFAEFDYLSNTVRQSVLADAPIDLIVYGMGELQITEIAKRLDAGEKIETLRDIPGTVWKMQTKEWKNDFSGKIPKPDLDLSDVDSPEIDLMDSDSIHSNSIHSNSIHFNSIHSNSIHSNSIHSNSIHSNSIHSPDSMIELPSFADVFESKEQYAWAFRLIYGNQNPVTGRSLAQVHPKTVIVQNPPMRPLTEPEMDFIYELPYTRMEHPSYTEPVPGLDVVRFSITSHRGCFGGCSFCAITQHQGRAISNRSEDSIIREAVLISESAGFGGIISGVGGPSANMYGMTCPGWEKRGACTHKNCLVPHVCPSLRTDHSRMLSLLKRLREIPDVKKVLTGYGVRFDLAVLDDEYLETLCKYHVGGQLKVAPEHFCDPVTAIMRKPNRAAFEKFENKFKEINKRLDMKQFLVTFQISGHPGCTIENAIEMAEYIRDNNRYTEQVQDFTPTPMTISTCMFHTGLNPFTMEKIHVPVTRTEKKIQRSLLQFRNPENQKIIQETLIKAGREDLIGNGWNCLVKK
ncbi:YgiQ family radical SAM protein [Methanolapillus ohkumae]